MVIIPFVRANLGYKAEAERGFRVVPPTYITGHQGRSYALLSVFSDLLRVYPHKCSAAYFNRGFHRVSGVCIRCLGFHPCCLPLSAGRYAAEFDVLCAVPIPRQPTLFAELTTTIVTTMAPRPNPNPKETSQEGPCRAINNAVDRPFRRARPIQDALAVNSR